MKSPTHFQIRAVAASAVFVLSLAAATATTTDVIFSCEEDEGEYADTDLETDSAGNIYGTTVLGGDFGSGTVFKLSPTPTGWVHTVLYSFTSGADGGEPYKGVTVDRKGNLYGTAVTGGSGSCEGGCGVVYKLTNSGGTWTQTVIHAFTGGDDGSGPGARVTLDRSGNVYGMAPTGGAYGLGTIYKIHPQHNGTWQLPPAALMEAELFSSLGPRAPESGISGQFIRSEDSRMVVFPMAPCCLIVWATSTERLITAELMVSALFTSYLPGLSANGTRVCSIASKKEATAIALSAILLLTASAICMGLRVRVAWVVALSLS
jgi:uncharacterized repeat protein (TIGR03803 family)